MEEKRKLIQRNTAGLNRSLSTDYIWPPRFGVPISFGVTAIMSNPRASVKESDPAAESSKSREESEMPNTDQVVIESDKVSTKSTKTSEIRSTTTKRTKQSKQSIISLEKRRNAIEMEKRRQELEHESRRVQYELEEKKRELDNNLRLLKMQEDLQNAELESSKSIDNSEGSQTNLSEISRCEETVKKWIDDIPENLNMTNLPVVPKINDPSSNNDIQLLCETISNVLKNVTPGTVSKSESDANEKSQRRQLMDKNFPYFDGNPQEWPLFHKQLVNLRKLCAYSNEDIILKLQRHLKGEAKSLVSGMLLTADNVDLIIHTLQRRFGRPELIIDTIIFKVKSMPFIKDNNLEKLILFSAEVNNMVSIMKSLESKGHLQNPHLIKELLTKLPELLKLSWGEIVLNKNGDVNLEDFSLWLENISNAACYVSSPCKYPKLEQRFHEGRKQERILSTSEIKDKKCNYCDGKYHDNNCPLMEADDIEKRWKIVTDKKLCFSCLGNKHHKFKCRYRKACGRNGCKLLHHQLLHKDLPYRNQEVITNESTLENDPEIVCTVKNTSSKILLRTIPVNLHGPNGYLSVLALCDEASTVTLLDEEIAKKLGLSGNSESLCLQWTNEHHAIQEHSIRLNLEISKINDENNIFTLNGVRTIKNLSLPEQTIKMDEWRKYSHLKDVPVQDTEHEKPVILIGQDNIHLILPRQIRCGPENLPVATKCRLGWSLHGPSPNKFGRVFRAHTLHVCEKSDTDEDLQELVRRSFSTESFGVLVTPDRMSKENERAMNIMRNTIRYTGERYEIGLLWRNDCDTLPESKYRALQRLKCIERKCSLNVEFAKAYCQNITSYIEKGYVRKLKPEEIITDNPHLWYLPHFAVNNPNKPDKIRLVFDAAATSKGVSLNSKLLAGPDLLQSLVAILWKFRQRRFGFCGDVREMFHQIQIREQDRKSQRFLWRNLESDREPDVYEMTVMTFGATCSPVCAQFVKNFNAQKFCSELEIQNAIINKFYVDDYLDSKDTEREALYTISEVCTVQKKGGFDVVNWMTNSQAVRKKLESDSVLAHSKIIGETSFHRILGLWWNTDDDYFSFKLNIENIQKELPTKRNVLKSIMSVFDPLGLISTFTVRGKILMQEMWRSKITWDTILPANLVETWQRWLKDLEKISEYRIPRCYSFLIPTADRIEIHTFCDSSEKVFATVCYLRVLKDQNIETSIIAAKTRVAPLKQLSVPRLELQAAVMGTRLAETIKLELEIPIDKMYFWTDSRCVLAWIRADGRPFKQFVSHRIGEIQEKSRVEDWRWVPGKYNIADKATRSSTSTVIPENWSNGPMFLKQPESVWPEEDKQLSQKEVDEDDNAKKEIKADRTCLLMVNYDNALPNINRFSKWLRLIRVTAWYLRFISNLKRDKKSGDLTVVELQAAEKVWIKNSQQICFSEEIQNLKAGKPIGRGSKLSGLFPEIKNGLLVIRGRTDLAICLQENTRQPIILSPKHRYTTLLIQYFHEKFNHTGLETVLNEIRQTFWIINGRAAVKSIFGKCLKCRINRSKPTPPLMGQLPEVRLMKGFRPFVNIGMDYFGPIFVKIGRRKEKRWGVIFTCLAVRAIHLEIAHTLNSDSTIMAIIRMSARRGCPQTIYCDNGTNLKGASRELKEAIESMDRSSLTNSMSSKGIDFKFLPPAAPHMAGVWERLIGSVKRVIGKILHDQSLREETLQTLFAEAESIVNCRPLTKVSGDPSDAEALTPNHFLLGYSTFIEEHALLPMNPEVNGLRREWKKSRSLVDSFWKRWVKEYLPSLTKRSKWTRDSKPIKVGDIVVVVDDQAPRYNWNLGKIISVYPGSDGRIRVVDVKTANSEYRRPVTKICKLELED